MLILVCQKHSIPSCPICFHRGINKTNQGSDPKKSAATPVSQNSSTTTNNKSATTTAGVASKSQNAPALNSNTLPGSIFTGTVTLSTISQSRGPKRTTTSASSSKEDAKTKKTRTTLIDDDVACEIFRELELTDDFLKSGKVLAWALDPENPAFINIHNYVCWSQRGDFGVKVLSILRVIPCADQQNGESPIVDFKDDPKVAGQQRMMLWHGTKKNNVASILENGFRIPDHFGMYGKGIYFADRVAKSVHYCDNGFTHNPGDIGYLFLCDVLLGNTYKVNSPMNTITAAPTTSYNRFWKTMGYGDVKNQSVKWCRSSIPNPWGNRLIDGCVWPMGKTFFPGNSFNEYVVYDTKQVQPKYLVKVEITPKPVYDKLE